MKSLRKLTHVNILKFAACFQPVLQNGMKTQTRRVIEPQPLYGEPVLGRCPWKIGQRFQAFNDLFEVTAIAYHRLQEIMQMEIEAEGVPDRLEFIRIWDSLYPKSNSWIDDPWVWAITFRKIDQGETI